MEVEPRTSCSRGRRVNNVASETVQTDRHIHKNMKMHACEQSFSTDVVTLDVGITARRKKNVTYIF